MGGSELDEITEFQIQVAGGWIDEARGLVDHPRLQFVAYFTALNALYWLWAMAEGRETFSPDEREVVSKALAAIPDERLPDVLRQKMFGGLKNEAVLIQALVEKLGEETARRIISEHADYIRFLHDERRRPVHRMDRRSRRNSAGDPSDGKKYMKWLFDPQADATKKLKAVASTLYLVRCNLMHGSKVAFVEDADLVARSIAPLRGLADSALEYTRQCPPK